MTVVEIFACGTIKNASRDAARQKLLSGIVETRVEQQRLRSLRGLDMMPFLFERFTG